MRGHLKNAACGRGERGKPTRKLIKDASRMEDWTMMTTETKRKRGEGVEREGERDGVCVRRRLFRSSFFSFFKQMTPISKPIFESIYHYMICCSTMGFIFSSCYIRTHAHVTHLNADKVIIVDVNWIKFNHFLNDERVINFRLLIIDNYNQIFAETMTQMIFMMSTCDYKNYSSNFELHPRCLKLISWNYVVCIFQEDYRHSKYSTILRYV